jgi:hypothetical protein
VCASLFREHQISPLSFKVCIYHDKYFCINVWEEERKRRVNDPPIGSLIDLGLLLRKCCLNPEPMTAEGNPSDRCPVKINGFGIFVE